MFLTPRMSWWPHKRRAAGRPTACKPRLEALEDRVMLTADVVVQWNTFTIDAVRADSSSTAPLQPGPTRVSRAFATVQAGIYDAVNSFQRLYTPYIAYVFVPPRAQDAAVVAAASYAGHDTLAYLFPNQTSTFDAELASSLLGLPAQQVTIGRAVGTAAAQQIIQARQNDGSGPENPAPGSTLTGQWRPTPPDYRGGLDPFWGRVTPFTLTSGSQFRPAPPPALNSAAYAAAYNDVKLLGGDGVTTPTLRTPDQTNIARFWSYDNAPYGTNVLHDNQILQTVVANFPPVAAAPHVAYARLFALVNLAQADSGISSWDAKYYYNLWRPITGIRFGNADNNPATQQDPTWTPLGYTLTSPNGPPFEHVTPSFPSYTSAHATFGGGMFTVLKDFYGFDTLPHAVLFFSDQVPNARTYTSFSQAEQENSDSRVYIGVHWRFDNTYGQAAGEQVGAWAFDHFLRPRGSAPAAPAGTGGGDPSDGSVVASSFPSDGSVVASSVSGSSAPVSLTAQPPALTTPARPERAATATGVLMPPPLAQAGAVPVSVTTRLRTHATDSDLAFSSPELFDGPWVPVSGQG